MEITPFARITSAYSFGIIVDDERVSSVGPRYQLLDQNQSYRGFEYSTLHPERSAAHALQRQMSYLLAHEFHARGFRGAFGVDFFDYLTPDGERRTAVTETNLRLDGTTPYLGLFFKFPEWHRQLFSAGARIAQFPAPLPRGFDCAAGDALHASFAHFRAMDIPLAHPEDPIGVFATNVPCWSKGAPQVGIGICADSDSVFHEWMARIERGAASGAALQ